MKEQYSSYSLLIIAIASLGGFLFGYQTSVISGALIFVGQQFSLTLIQEGIAVSIILIGAFVGAMIAGALADRFGRRAALFLTSILFLIGTAVVVVAQSFQLLLLGRFIAGLGVGIVSLVAPLYLAEIAPSRYRGGFVVINQLAVTIGILIAYLVNSFFAARGDWRWMFGLGMVPALLQLIGIFLLPETPPWLLEHGYVKKAKQSLSLLRKDKNWQKHLNTVKSMASTKGKASWKILLQPSLRLPLMIGILLSIFQQVTGINVVIYYAPKIFQIAGFQTAETAILATLGIGIVNVLATIFSVFLLDRLGRRFFLLLGVGGMVVSLLVLSSAFFSQTEAMELIASGCLMTYVIFFAIGLGPITWVILSEIYPLRIRGKAMSLATAANWCFNYLVSLTFLSLVASISITGTFIIYALIGLISFWFIWRYIPETKGRTLEEIETSFSK